MEQQKHWFIAIAHFNEIERKYFAWFRNYHDQSWNPLDNIRALLGWALSKHRNSELLAPEFIIFTGNIEKHRRKYCCVKFVHGELR